MSNLTRLKEKGIGVLLAGMLVVLAWGLEPVEADEPPLERIATIALKGPEGPPDHPLVDTQRSRLFVANQINNSLDIVDLESGQLAKQVPDQKKIHGIGYVRHLNRVYVGNGEGGLTILDGRDYQVIKSIPLKRADNVQY